MRASVLILLPALCACSPQAATAPQPDATWTRLDALERRMTEIEGRQSQAEKAARRSGAGPAPVPARKSYGQIFKDAETERRIEALERDR